jgi:hypothetical protein
VVGVRLKRSTAMQAIVKRILAPFEPNFFIMMLLPKKIDKSPIASLEARSLITEGTDVPDRKGP